MLPTETRPFPSLGTKVTTMLSSPSTSKSSNTSDIAKEKLVSNFFEWLWLWGTLVKLPANSESSGPLEIIASPPRVRSGAAIGAANANGSLERLVAP
ncbi:hypothetical protein QQP08_020213 [Theobroma cacao]|nr:hypothetical protein QQP08_020213 [Theobroma cacao]